MNPVKEEADEIKIDSQMKKTNRDMAQNKEYSCINYKTVEPSLSLKSLGEHFLVGEGTYGKVYRCKLKEQIRNNV